MTGCSQLGGSATETSWVSSAKTTARPLFNKNHQNKQSRTYLRSTHASTVRERVSFDSDDKSQKRLSTHNASQCGSGGTTGPDYW